jgi:hypothetical protein
MLGCASPDWAIVKVFHNDIAGNGTNLARKRQGPVRAAGLKPARLVARAKCPISQSDTTARSFRA